MTGLIQAEWLKLRKQGTAWIILLTPVTLTLIAQISSVLVVANNAPISAAQKLYSSSFLPETILQGFGVVSLVSGLLTIVLIAMMISGEYSQNTWKNILIRYPQRHNFLLTKLLVGMFWLFLTLLASGVAGAIFGFIPNLILPLIRADLQAAIVNNDNFLAKLSAAVVPTLLQMLVFSAITIALTIVTRSTVGGIAIALVYTTLEGYAGILVQELHDFTIGGNITALTHHLQNDLKETIPVAQSLMVLLIYIAVALTISISSFRRADIAGV